MIYLITIVVLFWGIFRYDVNGKGNKTLLKILIIWLALLSALSYKLGTDIMNYMTEFYTSYKNVLSRAALEKYVQDRYQPGWVLLNYCCYHIFGDFAALKIIHAIIVNCGLYYFIKRMKVPPFTFLTLFSFLLWFQVELNILREGLAIACFFFAVPHLVEWNWKKYYIFAFLAFMFHFSALILFFIPILRLINYKSNITIYTFASILVVLPVFLNFSGMTESVNTTLNLLEYTSNYSMAYLQEEETTERSLVVLFLRLIVIIVPIIYVWKKDPSKMNVLVGGALLYMMAYIISTYITAFHRISQYFEPIYYVFLAEFIITAPQRIAPAVKRILILVLLLIYLIPAYNFYFGQDALGNYRYNYVYPYTSIFNKSDADFRNSILP